MLRTRPPMSELLEKLYRELYGHLGSLKAQRKQARQMIYSVVRRGSPNSQKGFDTASENLVHLISLEQANILREPFVEHAMAGRSYRFCKGAKKFEPQVNRRIGYSLRNTTEHHSTRSNRSRYVRKLRLGLTV
ncbi:hypothetical protein RvY_07716 [Ramazzottius varieornatus]|uniref:Uncharacterized protein n=1 Tax=Ramazzottius varieornatus TaxID=947166 RepID=A0A1D1V670_RAMVA|nr:hypothetical protein RvY_07716 [Ramazzottius varieornatus]